MADATENAFHLVFLLATGPLVDSAYFVAGVAASVKWLRIVIFVAAATCALFANRVDPHP